MNVGLTGTSWVAALGFAAGIAVSAQIDSSGPRPDPLEAVTAAPKNHKVLFEDHHVRLLEVTVQPGETENMHLHPYPSVLAYDAAQPSLRNRTASGQGGEVGRNFEGVERMVAASNLPPEGAAARVRLQTDLKAALALGWPAAMALGPDRSGAHQVTNIDTFPHHFYRLEFKKMDGNDIMKLKSY
jgi:hypothetical protein